jgi:hypothetical protein
VIFYMKKEVGSTCLGDLEWGWCEDGGWMGPREAARRWLEGSPRSGDPKNGGWEGRREAAIPRWWLGGCAAGLRSFVVVGFAAKRRFRGGGCQWLAWCRRKAAILWGGGGLGSPRSGDSVGVVASGWPGAAAKRRFYGVVVGWVRRKSQKEKPAAAPTVVTRSPMGF